MESDLRSRLRAEHVRTHRANARSYWASGDQMSVRAFIRLGLFLRDGDANVQGGIPQEPKITASNAVLMLLYISGEY